MGQSLHLLISQACSPATTTTIYDSQAPAHRNDDDVVADDSVDVPDRNGSNVRSWSLASPARHIVQITPPDCDLQVSVPSGLLYDRRILLSPSRPTCEKDSCFYIIPPFVIFFLFLVDVGWLDDECVSARWY